MRRTFGPWQGCMNMINDNELELINQILAGEQARYALIVQKYKSYVFTIALRILQNRFDAEEAAQDAFVKAYQNLGAFNRQAKFSTWLYRIAVNTAISHHRKNNRRLENIESAIREYHQDEESSLEKMDKTKFMNRAMEKLTEADRAALTLFYLKELSLEEIAEVMNMQANTIKVRLHRARQRFADELTGILKKEALTL